MSEVVDEFLPFFRIHKHGGIERLLGVGFIPPSVDPQAGVSSKDVIIVPETGVSARLFVPKNVSQKLPVLIYFHGGGFCVESAFSPTYHNYISSLVAEANVVAVSVEYRLAPEHRLPISYEDSWEAIRWVISHAKGDGPEAWLTDYADFNRLFLAGESAGGNISHHMAMRAGEIGLENGLQIRGVVLVQPYFLGEVQTKSEMMYPNMTEMAWKLWSYACPSSEGKDHPWINPLADTAPSLTRTRLGCSKILVFVAGADSIRDRGWLYHEQLRKSGWKGEAELMEIEGEGHVFHLHNPSCEKAMKMMKCFASFLNN